MVANDQKTKGQGEEALIRRIKPIRDLISDHDGVGGVYRFVAPAVAPCEDDGSWGSRDEWWVGDGVTVG